MYLHASQKHSVPRHVYYYYYTWRMRIRKFDAFLNAYLKYFPTEIHYPSRFRTRDIVRQTDGRGRHSVHG